MLKWYNNGSEFWQSVAMRKSNVHKNRKHVKNIPPPDPIPYQTV